MGAVVVMTARTSARHATRSGAAPRPVPPGCGHTGPAPAGRGGGSRADGLRCGEFKGLRRERRYLTAPALRPATKLRWSSRKPTTIGTLTTSDAAMIWFQKTAVSDEYSVSPTASVRRFWNCPVNAGEQQLAPRRDEGVHDHRDDAGPCDRQDDPEQRGQRGAPSTFAASSRSRGMLSK